MGIRYVTCIIYFMTTLLCQGAPQWEFKNTFSNLAQKWDPSASVTNMLGTGDSSPASVFISGDPSIDQILGLKVTTPTNIYNVKLQRVNHKLFHEDVRYLSVSTDRNGKTVFTEEYKPIDLHTVAKKMNFYHDVNTGTFLNIKVHKKGGSGDSHHFIEGVMFDELMVAPPKLRHRHKRDLFKNSHTLWKQDNITDEAFHYDVLKVPEFVDKLQINHSKVHKKKRKKRQVRPPRIEPELLLFVDYALYRDFDGDSNELLEYLLHFWHAVNWKYLTVALAGQWPVIDLKIREIGVFKEPNAQPFIESSRLYKGSKLFSLYDAMDSLKEWLIKYENVLPVHDVAFLQSGENACRKGKDREVITPYSPNALTAIMRTMPLSPREAAKDANECVKGTAGVAYVRGACLSAPLLRGNAYNFGIGEASTSFNGVIIAAHEVGHLLGAYHDGEAEASGCSSQSGFIMSYTRDDSFKFSRFSECSVRSFQNFLRMDRSACLMKRSSRETLQFPTTFPGKYMTLKEQCRRFTGGPPCEVSVAAGGPGVPEGTYIQVRSTSVDRFFNAFENFCNQNFFEFLKRGSFSIISHQSCHVFRRALSNVNIYVVTIGTENGGTQGQNQRLMEQLVVKEMFVLMDNVYLLLQSAKSSLVCVR